MTGRAELVRRLNANAAEFRRSATMAMPIRADWEKAALTCEEAAAALSAEEGGADARSLLQTGNAYAGSLLASKSDYVTPEFRSMWERWRERVTAYLVSHPQPRKDGESIPLGGQHSSTGLRQVGVSAADVPVGASEDVLREIYAEELMREGFHIGSMPGRDRAVLAALRRLSPTADLPMPNKEALHDEVSEIIAGYVTIEEYFEGDHRKRRITDCGPAAEAVLKHLKSYGLLHTADLLKAAKIDEIIDRVSNAHKAVMDGRKNAAEDYLMDAIMQLSAIRSAESGDKNDQI